MVYIIHQTVIKTKVSAGDLRK